MQQNTQSKQASFRENTKKLELQTKPTEIESMNFVEHPNFNYRRYVFVVFC